MEVLVFSDVLKKIGMDPAEVVLIRHSLKDPLFRGFYDAGLVQEYTSHQSTAFHNGAKYWIVFISDYGTMARFHSMYRVGAGVADTEDMIPSGLPNDTEELYKKLYKGEGLKYNLVRLDDLKEYEQRLVIEWGGGTANWHHWATNEKPITMIEADRRIFPGYDNVLLTFDELKEIVDNEQWYQTWHTTLSSISGIYLIVDRASGRSYVGSAYGEGGILGRWKEYVMTKHGGNKRMKELLSVHPDGYHDFQFSILRVLPKTVSSEEAIGIESLYKKKLCSIQFGLNDN